MELKWTIPQYREKLIPRLGGLHTSMAFLNVIGHHMQCSGLAEAWVESGLLGPVAVKKAMAGKSYSKGMRDHKLTVQALWQIVYPLLIDYMDEHDTELKEQILNDEDIKETISLLQMNRFEETMIEFVKT